jgi:hypothetical protein
MSRKPLPILRQGLRFVNPGGAATGEHHRRELSRFRARLDHAGCKKGAQIILFTDQWRSPIEKFSSFCFSARIVVPSAWDSTVELMLLVETFIAAVQKLTWPQTRTRMEELEEMFDRTRFFRKFTWPIFGLLRTPIAALDLFANRSRTSLYCSRYREKIRLALDALTTPKKYSIDKHNQICCTRPAPAVIPAPEPVSPKETETSPSPYRHPGPEPVSPNASNKPRPPSSRHLLESGPARQSSVRLLHFAGYHLIVNSKRQYSAQLEQKENTGQRAIVSNPDVINYARSRLSIDSR